MTANSSTESLDWKALAQQRGAYRRTGALVPTLAELARDAAQTRPDEIAFYENDARHSFASLYAQGLRLAASLRALGLKPGEVLSFQLPNWTETAVINIAANLCGLVVNPVVPIYREGELIGILGDCRSRIFFIPGVWRGIDFPDMARKVAAAVPSLRHVVTVRAESALSYEQLLARGSPDAGDLPAVGADEVKLVMYTSGTTGPAKGVLHSHASLPYAIETAMRRWGFTRGDRLLMPSPVTHITGYCIGLELPFSLQTATVLMERWDAQDALRLIEQHQIAGTVGATPFLQQLCEAAEASGGSTLPLKVFACGGAAVPGELIRRAGRVMRGYACRCYGSTEAPLITAGRGPEQPEALGADTDGCIADYAVRLVDAEDRDVADGVEGEILARGHGLFLGYANPAATRESFTADGYFRTGDLGVRRDGTITITGRKKDLIIRGGENLSAKEIEDALLLHPAVIEASVVSGPDARMGESVCAFLRTRDGAKPTVVELAAVVRNAGLAKQKCPEHVRVLEDFPRTPSGKIRKDQLRAMIRAELAGASTPP